MTRDEVFTRLNKVFREVFDDDSLVVNEKTTADDIEDWDSFEHINLIVSIEHEFDTTIPMGRVVGFKNVGDMALFLMEQGR